jgi:glycosyltransferase involved in cell wall biosynthesis
MRLGVVANEYFDPTVSRLGGFGFAAQQAMGVFLDDPSLGVEVVCLPGRPLNFPDPRDPRAHGVRAVPYQGGDDAAVAAHRAALRAERPDLLLTIDYRPSYDRILRSLRRTPAVIWVRDPRTPADWAAIDSLRVPGSEEARPQGLGHIDCTPLRWEALRSKLFRRRLLFATLAPHLADKMPETYGLSAPVHLLPNIVPAPAAPPEKAERPTVVYLGRLDPIKRPWIVFELAARMPDVDFVIMGKAHFAGAGAWAPPSLPLNLRLTGHVEGREKERLLGAAWLTVNTSIHEAVAFSFFESLACRTPMVAGVEMGGLVAQYGAFVGRFGGTGLQGLDAYERALRQLLDDHATRERKGAEGAAWVARTHTREAFLDAFAALCARAGVRWPAGEARRAGRPREPRVAQLG